MNTDQSYLAVGINKSWPKEGDTISATVESGNGASSKRDSLERNELIR
jgi:hypothetical protein